MITTYNFGYVPARVEIVERKGRGHPDTLADGVAEAISRAYSQYCIAEFGDVLHHNCDKVAILGGRAKVRFGEGRVTHPIRIVLNGRFSASFGGVSIPWWEITAQAARDYLAAALPALEASKDVVVYDMGSTAASPGVLGGVDPGLPPRSSAFMFAPRNRADLTQSTFLESNDTSVGVGYAPYNIAHQTALEVERWLTSDDTTAAYPYLGRDVKIMAIYDGESLRLTGCVPFIANYTPSLDFYTERLAWVRSEIVQRARAVAPANVAVHVDLNTRDVPELKEVYLTATDSSIESGDEGVVGRGNRLHGVIHFSGPMSLEAPHGKNPIYHAGKLYPVLADEMAKTITGATLRASSVHLISQSGRDLRNPWICVLSISGDRDEALRDCIAPLIEQRLAEIDKLSERIIRGDFPGLR